MLKHQLQTILLIEAWSTPEFCKVKWPFVVWWIFFIVFRILWWQHKQSTDPPLSWVVMSISHNTSGWCLIHDAKVQKNQPVSLLCASKYLFLTKNNETPPECKGFSTCKTFFFLVTMNSHRQRLTTCRQISSRGQCSSVGPHWSSSWASPSPPPAITHSQTSHRIHVNTTGEVN